MHQTVKFHTQDTTCICGPHGELAIYGPRRGYVSMSEPLDLGDYR